MNDKRVPIGHLLCIVWIVLWVQGVASLPFITRAGINSCFADCKGTIFGCTKANSLPRWLVGFLLVLTAEAGVGNSTELKFCFETKECLLFNLVCDTDQYEVRRYDTVKWVSTKESFYFMEIAAMRAFRRLYEYITGSNSGKKKIEMTAPVIVKMSETPKYFWETNEYTMSFLLPSKYQKKPPKPTDKKVYIEEIKSMKVYVKSYGGWMTSMNDKNNAKSLASSLDFVGAKFKKDFHYAVGYNSPMTLFNRHNEVWYVVQGDPECSSSEEMGVSPLS